MRQGVIVIDDFRRNAGVVAVCLAQEKSDRRARTERVEERLAEERTPDRTRNGALPAGCRTIEDPAEAGRTDGHERGQGPRRARCRANDECAAQRRTDQRDGFGGTEFGNRVDDLFGEQIGRVAEVRPIGETAAEQIERDDAMRLREQRKQLAIFVRRCARVDAVHEDDERTAPEFRREYTVAAPIPASYGTVQRVRRRRHVADAAIERCNRTGDSGTGRQRANEFFHAYGRSPDERTIPSRFAKCVPGASPIVVGEGCRGTILRCRGTGGGMRGRSAGLRRRRRVHGSLR